MRNDHTELWNTPKGRPQRRNTAQALAQGGAKVWDDHAELRNSAKRSAAPEYRASEAQAVAVEAPKGWRGEDSAKRSAAPEYRASEAQAGTKTPVKQGASQERFAHEARRPC